MDCIVVFVFFGFRVLIRLKSRKVLKHASKQADFTDSMMRLVARRYLVAWIQTKIS